MNLEKCPFCGCADISYDTRCRASGETFKRVCEGCGASSEEFYALTEADEAWNRRAQHPDTKRLDWLADPNQSIGDVVLPRAIVERNVDSLRAAIDEAMQA